MSQELFEVYRTDIATYLVYILGQDSLSLVTGPQHNRTFWFAHPLEAKEESDRMVTGQAAVEPLAYERARKVVLTAVKQL